jgi:hypothetical protein
MVVCQWNNSGIPQIITFLSPEELLYEKTSKIFGVFLKQKSAHFKKNYANFYRAFAFFCFLDILIIPKKVTFRAGLYMNFL